MFGNKKNMMLIDFDSLWVKTDRICRIFPFPIIICEKRKKDDNFLFRVANYNNRGGSNKAVEAVFLPSNK